MDNLQWFALFAGSNGLIVLALACLVSWRRIHLRIPHGDGDQRLMKQAIRCHGNAVEHVPIMGLILLALCLQGAGTGLIAGLTLSFTLARLLHPIGMLSRHFNARRLGALLSYLAEGGGAVAALLGLLR